MANTAESGVVITGGSAEALASRMERALQSVGERENVEALVIGLGVAALAFLLGYAIIIVSKCAVGISLLSLG